MSDRIKNLTDLKKFIREIPDFPKPGILFYDITTLLKEADVLRFAMEKLAEHYAHKQIDYVVGIEARGFIFAITIAYLLNAGFVPVRKPKKLPAETCSVSYDLEYGKDTLEMHKDSIAPHSRVLVIDDLLATGGTAAAAVSMLQSLNVKVVGLGFLMELAFLQGREKLAGQEVYSLIQY